MIEVNDLSSGQYSVNKNVRFKTLLIRSNLCNYSDAYIIVKGTITAKGDDNDKNGNKNTFTDNIEDLDFVLPIYSLLEYSDNFSMTPGSLWNYCKDEINEDANEIPNNGINNNNKKNK